jgi:hypothetical protein
LSKDGEVGEVEELSRGDRTLPQEWPDSVFLHPVGVAVKAALGPATGHSTVIVTGRAGPAVDIVNVNHKPSI